jgi:hypothetical protein
MQFTSSPFFFYCESLIPHEDGQVDSIKKGLLVVCTQRKEGDANSQSISNVGAPYICGGSKPTLPNVNTSSTDWATSVIALSCTINTHLSPKTLFSLHHHPNILS